MKGGIIAFIPVLLVFLILSILSRQVNPDLIRQWTESAGIFGPLLIIFLGVVTTIVAPLSGSPLLFIGFALYGPSIVFLLTISGLISAAVNFYIARRWGRPLVARFVGEKNMTTVDKFVVEHGVVGLFILRVLLGSLNDYISYALGLTVMKFKTYYLVSLAAAVINALIWYTIALNSKTPLVFALFTTIFVGVFSLVFLVIKFAQDRLKNTDGVNS